ncbi:MAG: hypothetical protein E7643_08475 [Ruminococcaceae bacterium]|nr:hypothetical protein [Oscillospiraceae bacterium]
MTEATKTKQTASLLQQIYKNVKSASDSILNLMPRVKDEKLKSDMTVQLSAYEAFASRAAKLLGEEGVTPEEDGAFGKLSAKWSAMMDTLRDSSTCRIAELMVKGANENAMDLQRELREAENGNASESALRLARDVCRFEEKNAEDMKEYLR